MAAAGKTTKLFSAWFCPFAQRSWIALLEKGVDFELVEIDPYDKTKEFLALNPRGLVPTLLHNGKTVYESLILNEYIDEAWPQAPYLMPRDPYERAQARIWIDFITKKIVPQFYHTLQQQDEAQQEQAASRLKSALRTFAEAMDPIGPFFFGKELSVVDIALIPFALRLDVLAHYRKFSLDADGNLARIKEWVDTCKSQPAVKSTIAPHDKMIAIYQRYADNTAKSELADAIRQGTILP